MQLQMPRKIDAHHAIEVLGLCIGGLGVGTLHAGIIESRIQPSKSGDSLRDHRRHFTGVGDIATHANRLVAGGN